MGLRPLLNPWAIARGGLKRPPYGNPLGCRSGLSPYGTHLGYRPKVPTKGYARMGFHPLPNPRGFARMGHSPLPTPRASPSAYPACTSLSSNLFAPFPCMLFGDEVPEKVFRERFFGRWGSAPSLTPWLFFP